jgi:hypothetical protein
MEAQQHRLSTLKQFFIAGSTPALTSNAPDNKSHHCGLQNLNLSFMCCQQQRQCSFRGELPLHQPEACVAQVRQQQSICCTHE